jgi:hypothetical protein
MEVLAIVTLTDESWAAIGNFIEKMQIVKAEQDKLVRMAEDVSHRLRGAVASAQEAVRATGLPQVDAYAAELERVDIGIELREACAEIEEYGYFEDGHFNLADAEIEVAGRIDANRWPRLAAVRSFYLRKYDPQTKALTIAAHLDREGAERGEDPEYALDFTLGLERARMPQTTSVTAERW